MSGEPVRIVTWLVDDGAVVARGDPLAELETDKSTVVLEAPQSGTLEILVAAGTDVDVDAIIAQVGDGSAPAPDLPGPDVAEDAVPEAPSPRVELHPGVARKLRASPAARRLAAEQGLDLDAVAGSGPGGRIIAADLHAAPGGPGMSDEGRNLREAVVSGISASWREIPHIHIGGNIDAEGLVLTRTALGTQASVTDILAFALVRALRDVPSLNGTFADGVLLSDAIHLSLAVATKDGVAAPTIRAADSLRLEQLAAERRRLVRAAQEGQLEKRDFGGGTVTLSNLGRYPVDFFAPIISGPQICLVATGRVSHEPVVIEGMIALRHRMWVNVAIDHRAADGEAGGRLLAGFEEQLSTLGRRFTTKEGE